MIWRSLPVEDRSFLAPERARLASLKRLCQESAQGNEPCLPLKLLPPRPPAKTLSVGRAPLSWRERSAASRMRTAGIQRRRLRLLSILRNASSASTVCT